MKRTSVDSRSVQDLRRGLAVLGEAWSRYRGESREGTQAVRRSITYAVQGIALALADAGAGDVPRTVSAWHERYDRGPSEFSADRPPRVEELALRPVGAPPGDIPLPDDLRRTIRRELQEAIADTGQVWDEHQRCNEIPIEIQHWGRRFDHGCALAHQVGRVLSRLDRAIARLRQMPEATPPIPFLRVDGEGQTVRLGTAPMTMRASGWNR